MDFEQPTVFARTVRTSRGRVACVECGRRIERGEQYEAVSGRWDGYWGAYRTCAQCCEVRKTMGADGEYAYGDLEEYCVEALEGWHLQGAGRAERAERARAQDEVQALVDRAGAARAEEALRRAREAA